MIPNPADLIALYGVSAGRWRHGGRIRERYGYRTFTDFGVAFRLNRFLYALCWIGTERPSALFERAIAWLLAAKVLLPGLSVLERTVAKVRLRSSAHLHRRLAEGLTPDARLRLDSLIVVPEGERQSPLDRLRDGPYMQSGPEIGRALARLDEIRSLAEGLPRIDRIRAAQIKTEDGSLDLVGYRLCVLDGLRRAIRRRDVFPVRSLRYADPRKGLLSGAAWEAARPAVCRTVGVSASAVEELGQLSSSATEELGQLSKRLDMAYRETAERLPANPAVAIVSTGDKIDLSVEALDKVEEPGKPDCTPSRCWKETG